jgi:hypothetical protein
MNTASNLLVILIFLSACYTLLGLLCGIAERLQEMLAMPHQRRRVRRWTRRRTPRRTLDPRSGKRAQRPLSVAIRDETA